MTASSRPAPCLSKNQSSIAARTRSVTSAGRPFNSNGMEMSNVGYEAIRTANLLRSDVATIQARFASLVVGP